MMRLQLEVTKVDHANHRVHTKAVTPAPVYQLSKRAVETFEIGQILEAIVQLPFQDPINESCEIGLGVDFWDSSLPRCWNPVSNPPPLGQPVEVALFSDGKPCLPPHRFTAWVVRPAKPRFPATPYGLSWYRESNVEAKEVTDGWCWFGPKGPWHYPVYNQDAYETKQLRGVWYKRMPGREWESLDYEIHEAQHKARSDGQPHVIQHYGYVSNDGEFIPYKRVAECSSTV